LAFLCFVLFAQHIRVCPFSAERLKRALEDKEEAENFLENMVGSSYNSCFESVSYSCLLVREISCDCQEFQLAEMQADRQRLELQVESSEQHLKHQYEHFSNLVAELEDKLQHVSQGAE
jgi:hypothetical protein